MRVIKKSWEGIQPEAPTMGNKNISYIEMGTLWARMLIFVWWDLFMLPTLVDWVNLVSSPLAIDSVHTWQQMNLSIYLEMKEVVKLVQVFFLVNSARVHGYPLLMFLDVSEWILEKMQKIRWWWRSMCGVNTRSSWSWEDIGGNWAGTLRFLKISCFAVRIWIRKFHLQTVGCRRWCSTIYPPTPPKKRKQIHGTWDIQVGMGYLDCFLSVGKYQTGKWTQIFNYVELLGNLVSLGKTFDGRSCWSGTPRNLAFIIPATMVMMLPMMSTRVDRWFERFSMFTPTCKDDPIFVMIMFFFRWVGSTTNL